MIKKIRIQNFQSHKDSTVEFSPHLTAIVGLNNHGKSAIFRACKKILRDYPEGNLFIREKQKQSNIELTTDSTIIERVVRNDKSVESNVYKVDGLVFTKFGKTGIPREVLDKTGVSSIQRFGDVEFDINFQNQLDELFLISGEGLASTRGKVIGKISGVDSVERAVQLASSDIKAASRSLDSVIEEGSKIRRELEKYIDIPSMVEKCSNIVIAQKKLDNYAERISLLDSIREEMVSIISEASGINKILKTLSVDLDNKYDQLYNKDAIRDIVDFCIYNEDRIKVLENITEITIPSIKDLEFTDNAIVYLKHTINYQTIIDNLANIENIKLPELETLNLLDKKYDLLYKLKSELFRIEEDIKEISKSINSLEKDLSVNENKLEDLKRRLGVCPTCGKEF